ncbi:Hypothetical predicted protein, partial [Pelobates cultripes]
CLHHTTTHTPRAPNLFLTRQTHTTNDKRLGNNQNPQPHYTNRNRHIPRQGPKAQKLENYTPTDRTNIEDE